MPRGGHPQDPTHGVPGNVLQSDSHWATGGSGQRLVVVHRPAARDRLGTRRREVAIIPVPVVDTRPRPLLPEWGGASVSFGMAEWRSSTPLAVDGTTFKARILLLSTGEVAGMPVFYTEQGRAYHYDKDCHQLAKGSSADLRTAAEDDLDRAPCHSCLARRALADRITATVSR